MKVKIKKVSFGNKFLKMPLGFGIISNIRRRIMGVTSPQVLAEDVSPGGTVTASVEWTNEGLVSHNFDILVLYADYFSNPNDLQTIFNEMEFGSGAMDIPSSPGQTQTTNLDTVIPATATGTKDSCVIICDYDPATGSVNAYTWGVYRDVINVILLLGRIIGYVLGKGDNVPVPTFTEVSWFAGQSAYTNPDGFYDITDATPGSGLLTVNVSPLVYEVPLEKAITLDPATSQQVNFVAKYLVERIWGYVKDDAGNRITGATVSWVGQTATTDTGPEGKGYYQIDNPYGASGPITASKSGYKSDEVMITSPFDGERLRQDFTLVEYPPITFDNKIMCLDEPTLTGGQCPYTCSEPTETAYINTNFYTACNIYGTVHDGSYNYDMKARYYDGNGNYIGESASWFNNSGTQTGTHRCNWFSMVYLPGNAPGSNGRFEWIVRDNITGQQASTNFYYAVVAPPSGYEVVPSYTGPCPPPGGICVRWTEDGYKWDIYGDSIKGWQDGGYWEGHLIRIAKGNNYWYYHIIDTNFRKAEPYVAPTWYAFGYHPFTRRTEGVSHNVYLKVGDTRRLYVKIGTWEEYADADISDIRGRAFKITVTQPGYKLLETETLPGQIGSSYVFVGTIVPVNVDPYTSAELVTVNLWYGG